MSLRITDFPFQSPFNRDSSCNAIYILMGRGFMLTFSPLLIGIAVVTVERYIAKIYALSFSPLLIGIAVVTDDGLTI